MTLVLVLIVAAFSIWLADLALRHQQDADQPMEGELALAQLASQLIDQNCAFVQSTLRAVAGRQVLANAAGVQLPENAAPQQGEVSPEVIEPLKVTGATSVEIYDADGARLVSYVAARDPEEVRGIIRRVGSSGTGAFLGMDKGGGGIFTLSALARDNGTTRALGIASYRVQVLASWLAPIWNASSRSVYVVDGAARLILASGSRVAPGFSLASYRPVQMALRGPGSSRDAAPGSGEQALLGYAPARVPGWAVLVARAPRSGSIPTPNLEILLVLLAILAVVVVLSTGGSSKRPEDPQSEEARRSAAPDYGSSSSPAAPARLETRPPGPQPSGRSGNYDRNASNRPASPETPLRPATQPPDGLRSSGAISVQQGFWKCAALSVRGTSHHKTGQPCQDASYCKVVGGKVLVGAVADGAGSASHSALGAKVAAKKAVETLAEQAESCVLSDDDEQWRRLLLSAMAVARENVEASAAGQNEPTRQLATTLILFAATPDFIAAAQIGDGAIVFQDRSGEIRPLTSPQSGEYINTTTFLVSPDAFKSVQQKIWRGAYTSIAAFTDGLQMLALNMPGGKPHPQFFAPLFDFFGKRSPEETLTELGSFLQSDRITSRADDDLTLMLAAMMR